MMVVRRWLGGLLAPMLCVSCGGDADNAGSMPDLGPKSSVARDTKLVGLTTPQVTQLCDWEAGRLGGYGRTVQCAGVTISVPANRAACIDSFRTVKDTSCPATVGDAEDCVNAAISGCNQPPVSCYAILVCAMPKPA